ncbi:MAG: VCBS repeat-containing protein [Desulfobacteraceae bacterium]|nr:MAG: VCBS repeat-containing protein [Desulfobacteraceae bacterium]
MKKGIRIFLLSAICLLLGSFNALAFQAADPPDPTPFVTYGPDDFPEPEDQGNNEEGMDGIEPAMDEKTIRTLNGYFNVRPVHTGDFNGDGYGDLAVFRNESNCWSVNVYLGNGYGGFGGVQRWATQQGGYWEGQKWHTGDFNNDGKTDFAKFWDDNGRWTADVHLSTGSAFIMQRWATQQGVMGQKWFIGDFNGDGKTDFARYYSGKKPLFPYSYYAYIYVHLSTGNSFQMQQWLGWGGYKPWPGIFQTLVTGDFDGNGRTDIAGFTQINGNWTADVYVSTGGSFTTQRWATQQGGYWEGQKWYTGDFNGDGKTDFAKFWDEGGNWTADVHLSTGSAFIIQRWATQQGVMGQEWFTGDFNGDGKFDFAKFRNQNGKNTAEVHIAVYNSNNGTGYFQKQEWAAQLGNWLNDAAWFSMRLNSDAKRDLIQINESFLNAWVAGSNSFYLYGNDPRYMDFSIKEFAIFETNGPQVFKRFVNGEWFWELCTNRFYDLKALIGNSGDKKSPTLWMKWLEDGALMDYGHIPGYGWYQTGGLSPDDSYWTATFFHHGIGGNHTVETIVNALDPFNGLRIPESDYDNNNWMEHNVYPWPRLECF